MSDTILRLLATLAEIPGKPGKITIAQLHARLRHRGYSVTRRSVERDLIKLSTQFPLACDDGHPGGWSWTQSGHHMSIPGMPLSAALTYQLLERYLTPLFPPAMLKDMEPQFVQARQALALMGADPVVRWSKRIASIPSGQPLIPPELKAGVRDAVYEALLRNRQVKVDYFAIGSKQIKSYRLHPLGLVHRAGVLYLVATAEDFSDPRQWALHRIKTAKMLDVQAIAPEGFDFDRYVETEKAFEFPTGKKIRLELIVSEWLARHLSESRLSTDQKIVPLDNKEGRSRVTATVMETQQLEWWLRGLGGHVEIKLPKTLRKGV
ncbi:MAG: helix-turn-helix transcriptional regulator [Sulfuricaulis sp.]